MANENDIRQLIKSPRQNSKAPHTKKAKADVSGIVEEDHAKYQIKAGRLGGTFVARAFPKKSAQVQGLIAEALGDSEEAAISALLAIIETRDVQRTASRRWDADAMLAIPSEIEFQEALMQARLSRAQAAMLRALAIADEGLTYSELASAAGYKSKDTGAKVFNQIGAMLADYLGIEAPHDEASNTVGSTGLLAVRNVEDAPVGDEAPVVWVMHDELRAAVRAAI